MADETGITLKIVLDHLQSMEQRFNARFHSIDVRFDQMDARMDRMERNITGQIDAIDKRLDAIEIEHLPKRVVALEAVVR